MKEQLEAYIKQLKTDKAFSEMLEQNALSTLKKLKLERKVDKATEQVHIWNQSRASTLETVIYNLEKILGGIR